MTGPADPSLAPNDPSSSDPPVDPPPQPEWIPIEVHAAPGPVPFGPKKTGGSSAVGAFRVFDEFAASNIRLKPFYAALNPGDKKKVDDIITNARPTTLRMYYLKKLEALLSLQPHTAQQTSAQNQASQTASVQQETAHQAQANTADPVQAQVDRSKEETASADPARVWTTLTGQPDATGKPKTFQVDRSNLKNIFVLAKIHLRGTPSDISTVEFIEDALEKFAAVPGYSVDVVFIHVTTPNPNTNDQPDVFEVNAGTQGWTNATHWTGNASALTHELHHLLGLDDRYDYIESHATNPDMELSDRLYWFAVQMERNKKHPGQTELQADPEGADHSVMGKYATNKPLDSDICTVIQAQNKAACVQARSGSPAPSPAPAPAPAPSPSPASGP